MWARLRPVEPMSNDHQYKMLDSIKGPEDLRRLSESELVPLADELRNFLLASVSQSGGHFAAGLGTVELTIALHYVFNTPEDRLVWDVGHQAYPHKVLTGRRERMHTIRKWGGLAPFPKRNESHFDTLAPAIPAPRLALPWAWPLRRHV